MARKVTKAPKKTAVRKSPKKVTKKAIKKTTSAKKAAAKPVTTRYVFILRHGLRGDHVGPNVNYTLNKNADPILTPLGHKQCTESGKFIKSELKKIEKKEGRKFDRVIVRCSPFIRTMASAARVCKSLGIKKAEKSYLMCELLQPKVYSSNPLPQLECVKKSAAKLDKEFKL